MSSSACFWNIDRTVLELCDWYLKEPSNVVRSLMVGACVHSCMLQVTRELVPCIVDFARHLSQKHTEGFDDYNKGAERS